MKIGKRAQLLFLLFVILGVYYPAIFAGFNTVDDLKMAESLEQMETVDIRGLFMPSSTFYYRPLLMLTFIADKHFWGLLPSFMHLENILLHALNAALVFVLARRIISGHSASLQLLPLLTALLFALHPINTESVNWISGRTDLLGTFFVLLSAVTLVELIYRQKRDVYLLFSSLLLSLAIMSKEVMVFFMPVALLLIWSWPAAEGAVLRSRATRLRQAAIFSSPFVFLGSAYFTLRLLAHGARDAGLRHLLHGYEHDFFNTVRIFLKLLGFYAKKLLLPLPLNFAIVEINDTYVWLGLLLFVGMVLLLLKFKNDFHLKLLCCALFLLAPALLVALVRVAWTPVAERYLYLPSIFFVISMVGLISRACGPWRKEFVVVPLCLLLLLPAGVATAQRNLIWQSNLSLYEDTARKSPKNASIRNELAVAYVQEGNGEAAEREIVIAQGYDSQGRKPSLYLNHAILKYNDGNYEEARKILAKNFEKKNEVGIDALNVLAKIDEQRLSAAVSEAEKKEILTDLFGTYEQIYARTRNPFYLYRTAQLLLLSGNNTRAAEYFSRAHTDAPASAHYKEAAAKLAVKLSAE